MASLGEEIRSLLEEANQPRSDHDLEDQPNATQSHKLFHKYHCQAHFTCIVCPNRRTAPFLTGEIRFAKEVTRARGRTRLLLGSCKEIIKKTSCTDWFTQNLVHREHPACLRWVGTRQS